MSKKTGYFIIFLLALLPITYVFFLGSLSFSDFSNLMRSTGRMLGLSGFVLFSLTLLLNTRLRFIERIFFGLDKVYRVHHDVGTIAFVFLIFHPLFLASQFIMNSLSAAVEFLNPLQNLAIFFGSFALFSMEFFLAITFLGKLKYQNWKFTHRFLGPAFMLATLHIVLIPSDVSRELALRIYMLAFAAIGITSYIYRTLLWRLLVRRHDYKISSIRVLDKITEVRLMPLGKPLHFAPRQFTFISINSRITTKEPHPFTISSSSYAPEIILSAKNLGDFTDRLKELKAGIDVKLEGPFGRFSFIYHPSKKYIFIAGGIGVTPFLSMLRSISDRPENYEFDSIDFYYSVKEENEAVFLEELRNISKSLPKNKRLNIFLHIANKEGFLTAKNISEKSEISKNSPIFICGPVAMMNSLQEQFVSSGIKKSNIHMEEFALL